MSTPAQAVARLIRETDRRRQKFEAMADHQRKLFQIPATPVQQVQEKLIAQLAHVHPLHAFI